MAERQHCVTRPERAALNRAARAEAQIGQDKAEVRRLAAELAEMREDRDRWRDQAERLSKAMARQKGSSKSGNRMSLSGPVPDHLHGWKAIGEHLGIKPDAARHLAREHGLPAFKIGTKTVAATKQNIRTWLAEREAQASAIVGSN